MRSRPPKTKITQRDAYRTLMQMLGILPEIGRAFGRVGQSVVNDCADARARLLSAKTAIDQALDERRLPAFEGVRTRPRKTAKAPAAGRPS